MKIALSMRVTEAAGYQERRDSISHDWLRMLQSWEMIPLLMPNLASGLAEYLNSLSPDLIVLTGGDDIGDTPERDAAEFELLDVAVQQSVPVLGVCRGMQMINARFGGTTEPVADHVACVHDVRIAEIWQGEYGPMASVNSYHNLAITPATLGSGLEISATAEDGGIEAFQHAEMQLAGIMWHPERDGGPAGDRALVERMIADGR